MTTSISGDESLVFQVKTREEGAGSGPGDYARLQLRQDRSHPILIPLAPDSGESVLVFERGALNNLCATRREGG